MLPLVLPDPENNLATPVPGVQSLVGLADFFQRQHLGDQWPYLSTLKEHTHLLESCSLAREEHAIEGLVLLVVRGEVAQRAENRRQPPEGLRGGDAINDRGGTHHHKGGGQPPPAGILESKLRRVLAPVVYGHVGPELL